MSVTPRYHRQRRIAKGQGITEQSRNDTGNQDSQPSIGPPSLSHVGSLSGLFWGPLPVGPPSLDATATQLLRQCPTNIGMACDNSRLRKLKL